MYLAARVVPPLDGLTEFGQAVLGAMLAGAILWISEAMALGLIALIVLVLLGSSPGMRPPEVFGGFASEVVLFLIGAAAIGAAVEKSGLADRAARFLVRTARGSPTRLFAGMIAGLPALALLVPSAITRNAILIPAYRDALDAMGVRQTDRAGRALMLALGVLNPLASSALLTGGITSITAASILGGFSWWGWFALMAAPYYALLFGGALLLRLITGRFESGLVSSGPREPARPYSAAETATLAVLTLASALWLTDWLHGLSPAIPALIGAALLLTPGIGVLSWKALEERLSWGLILTVGTSLSLAAAMTKSGAAAWLGDRLVGPIAGLGGQPLVVVGCIVIGVATVHLAITNLAACVALLLPMAAAIGQSVGLSPIVCGLIVTIVVDAVILYPVQTAANLLAYESGYYDGADVRRFGLAMLGLTMAVVLAAIPYWSLLGLSLVTR